MVGDDHVSLWKTGDPLWTDSGDRPRGGPPACAWSPPGTLPCGLRKRLGSSPGGRKLLPGNNYVTWLYENVLEFVGELLVSGPMGSPAPVAPGATRPGYPLYLRNYMSVIRPRLWITLWTTFSGEGREGGSRASGTLLHQI